MNNYPLHQMQFNQPNLVPNQVLPQFIHHPDHGMQQQQQWVLRPGNAPPPQLQQQQILQQQQQQQQLQQPIYGHPLQHFAVNLPPTTSQPPPLQQQQAGGLANGYATYPNHINSAAQSNPLVASSGCLTSDSIMTPSPVVHMAMNGGGIVGALPGSMTSEECGIREVWAHNLDAEFGTICQVIQKYSFVAMDTEFPGVVARPIGEFKSTADYQYQLLRCNVDLLKIIQLGLTFLDDKGKLPESGPSTWQFNFKFNLTEDMYAEDSVDLLQNSGIQFEKHEQEGIDPIAFAELMLISGLVLMENVKWLSFHSGYDFGYLLNLLTNQNLPKTEGEFFELLKLYFPNVYDVKYLMKSCKNLKGGLQEVANELGVQRIGPQHQAGSDSLLTGLTFFRMKEMFFEDDIDDSKYCGHLYGLGTNFVVGSNNSTSGGSTSNVNNSATSSSNTTSGGVTLEASSSANTGTSTPSETGNAENGNSEVSSEAGGGPGSETNGSQP